MIAGLSEIAHLYDAFIIDQFGVIHDGRTLYPGAGAALSRLKRLGKSIAVVTNSGKRADHNRRRLIAMGLEETQFDAVVSSGEAAWRAIASGALAVQGPALVIGKDGEDYGFGGLDLAFTQDPGQARTILILGTNVPLTPLEAYRALLTGPALRGVPLICCNPDLRMLTPGGLLPAPGAIAAIYAGLGGPVTQIGKPEPAIYRLALEMLGEPAPRRTLCIGDSIDHDVKGGENAGLDAALALTGIAAGVSEAEALARCETLGLKAPHILPALVW